MEIGLLYFGTADIGKCYLEHNAKQNRKKQYPEHLLPISKENPEMIFHDLKHIFLLLVS